MKYKNAKIDHISTRGCCCWYIVVGNSKYLSKSGEVINWHEGHHVISNTDHLIMHPTREQAQATLDKYNKSEPTLAEIKQKLSAAKELIGKKIKVLRGVREGLVGEVLSVRLILNEDDYKDIAPLGPLGSAFFKGNGYLIHLVMEDFRCLYDEGVFGVVSSISVKNHSGEEYFAEQHDKYWQFGCAKISKKMIEDSLKLIDTNYADGNRKVDKITIGAADFDMDTLKKLVDADNNK